MVMIWKMMKLKKTMKMIKMMKMMQLMKTMKMMVKVTNTMVILQGEAYCGAHTDHATCTEVNIGLFLIILSLVMLIPILIIFSRSSVMLIIVRTLPH